MNKTPYQRVVAEFQTRPGLVDAILPLLESKDEDTRSRLMGTTNAKLLRIYDTAQIVKSRFGSRKNLVEGILAARYPNNGTPDDGFLRRVEEASDKRLLDIHRQVVGK